MGKLTVLKKQDNRSKTESLVLSPMSPNQNFITVLVSPTNGLLNQAIRNHPVSVNEIICLIKPCHPLKQWFPTFLAPETSFVKTIFPQAGAGGGVVRG